MWRQVYDALAKGEPTEALRASLRESLLTDFDHMSVEKRDEIGDPEQYVEKVLDKDFNALGSKWGRFLLSYDPRVDHAKMDSRMLALYGGKDSQVNTALNAPVLEETFGALGKEHYEITLIENANHLFQEAVTGAVSEYPELPKEFVPGYLESITDWVLNPT